MYATELSENSVEFIEHVGTGRGGQHELPPCQWPGDVALDPEEDAMNAEVRSEVARLQRELGDALKSFGITPGLHWSGDASSLTVDALPWQVTIFTEVHGRILCHVAKQATLTAAVDEVLAMRRSAVGALAPVAPTAEGQAA